MRVCVCVCACVCVCVCVCHKHYCISFVGTKSAEPFLHTYKGANMAGTM